jgi:hypothetical protein
LTRVAQFLKKTSLQSWILTEEGGKVLFAKKVVCVTGECMMRVDRERDGELSARPTANMRISEERENVDHGRECWGEALFTSSAASG